MQQTANSRLEEYLDIVRRHYSLSSFRTEASKDEFFSSLSGDLKEAWNNAGLAASNWGLFINNIQNKPWVRFIRDWGMANRQCYKVIIGLKDDSSSAICSIVLFLSFIDKKIGFLYVDMNDALVNHHPFYDYSSNPSRRQLISFASYLPLNRLHATLSSEILVEINKVFPDFTLFDNRFADFKIEAIQTEEDDFYNIDLFMVFFERGLPAGIPT